MTINNELKLTRIELFLFDNLFVDIWYIYLQPTLLYHFTSFFTFLFGISSIHHNDQFKARNHIFMFMFSHRTFFPAPKDRIFVIIYFCCIDIYF